MSLSPSNRVDYSGQKDFYDPARHAGKVTIVGAGGIGSPTALSLARLGIPNIAIYDDDDVEPRNVASQHYDIEDINYAKVYSIARQVHAIFSDNEIITAYKDRVHDDSLLTGDIVISAVDSMESRKAVFTATKNSPTPTHLIDGRLGGELIVVYVIDLSNNEKVEWYLSDDIMFDDSESVSQVCTARAVIDVSYAVAALITRSVRRILTNQDVEALQILNMETMRLDVHM